MREVLVIVLCWFAIAAEAANLPGPYALRNVRVVDGDTIEGEIQLWDSPDIKITTKFRARGADGPEKKAAGTCERILYDQATEMAQAWVGAHAPLEVSNIGADKYNNRYDADIIGADGALLAADLIRSGHLRPYNGGRRQPWCAP